MLPDHIEMCDECERMYDTESEGCYYEIEGKNFCGACEHLSNAAYCDSCMADVWKSEARDEERGMYLCDECRVKKQD